VESNVTSRYHENRDTRESTQERDFIPRNHMPGLWKLVLAYAAVFLAIGASLIKPELFGDPQMVSIIALVGVAVLSAFTFAIIMRNYDQMMATEFQNLFFASSARLHSRFCLILRKDGSISYYDPGFQEMFPDFTNTGLLTLQKLFDITNVDDAESSAIFDSLAENQFGRAVVNLYANGKTQKTMMTIDPLPRPSGFFLLRGRDYVERSDQPQAAEAPAAATDMTTEWLKLMEDSTVGAYTTLGNGKLDFTNGLFEQSLGYKPGEMQADDITLQQLIEGAGQEGGSIQLEEFSGEVTFKTKAGQLLQGTLNQKLRKGATGAIEGAIATVDFDATKKN
jgi:PAS domain-containing protein